MKKILTLAFISILFLNTLSSFAQREKESINESWKQFTGDIAGAEKVDFNDATWQTVNLPHTWNAIDAYTQRKYFKGIGWYHKNLLLTNKYIGKKLFINFEGVFLKANIYINGKFVGEHKGGYTAFTFDISNYVTIPGQNSISIKVDNSKDLGLPPISGDYTLFGGIYRDVYLMSTNEVHFDEMNLGSSGVFIETPLVNDKNAIVKVSGTISNQSTENKNVTILSKVIDKAGVVVTEIKSKLKLTAGSNGNFEQLSEKIAKPNLWSTENPYLYTVQTSILSDDKTQTVLDVKHHPLGFRWFSFNADSGFYLNGKYLKLIGAARHQDFMGLGNALDNDLQRRDIELLKAMGGNFIRVSHYPQDPSLIEMCDKLGILVWEETPLGNTFYDNEELKATCMSSLKEMIRQHYNHPSIIIWGYMNEVGLGTAKMAEKEKKKGIYEITAKFAKVLDSIVHAEDKNRLSTMAQNSGGNGYYKDYGLSSTPNVIGWNTYYGWYKGAFPDFGSFMDKVHTESPEIKSLISEYGAGSDQRLHSLNPEQFDFSIEWQQLYHESYLNQIFSRKYIAGAAVWNLIDFCAAGRQESMPHINNKGLLYNNRTPKDVYYLYQAWLVKTPIIHIASRDWQIRKSIQASPNDRTVTQPIKIYSNLDQVELFVNGISNGIQSVNKGVAVWNVAFVNGKNSLIAKGVNANKNSEDAMQIDFEILPAILNQNKDKSFELAVNIGSNCFFIDPINNITWLPDQPYKSGSFGYVGGEIFRAGEGKIGHQSEVNQTRNVPLYQTFRYGLSDYKFDVADGEYEVELHFADLGNKSSKTIYDVGESEEKGKETSQFNVILNGNKVLEDFCPAAQYGPLNAVYKTFVVQAKDLKGIIVSFEKEKGNPFMNAIKVRRLN
jgi:beta-galactosidase